MPNPNLYCNACKGHRNQTIQHNYDMGIETFEADGKEHFASHCQYQILTCNGCGQVSFRSLESLPNFWDFDEKTQTWSSEDKVLERLYPERLKDFRQSRVIPGMPETLRKVYHETVEAYNAGLFLLCSTGMRYLTDAICNHYGIQGSTIETRIQTLAKNGIINLQEAAALNAHKFLGNDALENQIPATREELGLALELIEAIMNNLFTIPRLRSKLAAEISRRMGESNQS
jgi:hypothetical protein